MEQYRAGQTLYIEASEAEATEDAWWLDQTISKVVRHNTDTDVVYVVVRDPTAPTIRTWMSPATFQDEQRMCSSWTQTFKLHNLEHTLRIDLPINDHRYTLKERIALSK
jgi:hypothetical protein